MKYLKFITLTIVFPAALIFMSLQIPPVQKFFFEIGVERLISNNFDPFSEADALTAVVCGSRSPIAHPTRAETCILIKAGDKYFIFDVGDGSVSNLVNWRIPLGKIHSVFISHLHADHFSDLADLHLWSWIGADRQSKLKVYGVEGILEVLDGIESSHQFDYKYRNQHHGDIFAPLDIAGFDGEVISEFDAPVYEDNGLKISSFLVQHPPIEPALGFKIEYKGRSIVISGDTIYSQNVLTASKNVDVLFHEAMSLEILETMNKFLPKGDLRKIGIDDIQTYHTPTTEAAKLAREAEVGHLVLYHLIPAPRNSLIESIFTRGIEEEFSDFTLSDDGTMVVLPVGSKDIFIETIID